ncbi:hypothetical protein OS493_017559 [Desmophyllum pertusum]|uniref:Uncharacterized protein n=1 Tax=Desmophyllum pertusum TaxID=174260 RepID=A0A9X0D2V0_9CNID|nr:hypothetical protein OS493_017559 [Desmophyllum pertusum]
MMFGAREPSTRASEQDRPAYDGGQTASETVLMKAPMAGPRNSDIAMIVLVLSRISLRYFLSGCKHGILDSFGVFSQLSLEALTQAGKKQPG